MIRSFTFNSQGQSLAKNIDLVQVPALLADPNMFLWLDLEKPAREDINKILDGIFHFHPLSIEDCVEISPVPKVEEYNPGPEDKFAPYIFMVIHAVDYNRKDAKFHTSELNFFLGKNFLVTYHDVPLRTTAMLEERLAKEVVRAPDRLVHLLLDLLVTNYKPALDELSQEISDLEQLAFKSPTRNLMNDVLNIKKEVRQLCRIIGPQSDVLARLAAGNFKIIRPKLLPYFRDVHDELVHIAQLAQGYADSLNGIVQVYLSLSSNQTGEVVKLLTLITVITTPLMMIGTWYGMNFKDMPELEWPHAYPIAAGVMIVSTIGTYLYFRMKKWL